MSFAPSRHHAARRSRSFRGCRDRRRAAHGRRGPEGELRIASHVSLAPTWFDPAETAGIITPFMMLYAMHDAMLKAMPDSQMAPCLAESCTMAPDGLSYAFTLRKGVLFHNGEALTADDVKFSLERYRGSSSKTLKERVAGVDIHDPAAADDPSDRAVAGFPDLLCRRHGAGWIVPRKYVQQVGEDGFKKAPVGAGPYKFVSFTPGVELVCEAFESYWRKPPPVKRLVFKVVPTRRPGSPPCSAARSTSPTRSAASWPTS
jgi:peptide/nickel transport system substrate-binding protein